jgi:all-beta uncharacterized protein/BACON domain-containing protein
MRSRGELMRCEIHTLTALTVACVTVIATACSKTETSITAPSAASDRCNLTVTVNPASFPPPGGQGSLTITTARDCTWSVASDAQWVAIGGDSSGQGEATVAYSVAANPVPSPRSAAIAVGGKSVAVSQQAAPCVFLLSRTDDTIGESGGRLSVGVTTLAGCRWTAASTASWITVAQGQSGDANGTVTLAVAANGGSARVGRVTIAGQNYTVSQGAAAVPPAPTPTPPAPQPGPTPTPSPTPTPTPTPPAPTPAPTPPSPTPAPTPTPPAPAPTPTPRHVDFSGQVSALSGRCPSVTFRADGRTIAVNNRTDFSHSKCDDLKNGRSVVGGGDVQANGTILATNLEVNKQ